MICIWAQCFFGVLNIELQNWVGIVQYATSHQDKYFPSILGHLEIPSNKLRGPKGDCYMHTSFTLLGTIVRTVIRGWDKFTQLGWWESLSMLKGQSAGHLAESETSSPSRCGKWFVKEDSNM